MKLLQKKYSYSFFVISLNIIFILSHFFFSSHFLTKKNHRSIESSADQFQFYQKKEFPNLFIPTEYRNIPSSQIPEKVIEESRAELELALSSVFNRLTISLMNESTKKMIITRYFPYVLSNLEKIDPDLKLVPSGGVVRSAMGYIYDQLYHGKSLKNIIQDTADIPGIDVRGIGSDFDVFLQSSNGTFPQLRDKLLKITNSAEEHYQQSQNKSVLKRAIFTIGDTKELNEHWDRSVSQGGSAIDWLGYDFAKKKFLEPNDHQDIVNKMISGVYEYLPAKSKTAIEDADKQTVRGFRPLLELPWLEIENDSVLKNEVVSMINRADRGELPSSKTIEQFGKLIRNCRYSGAHNRFYRSQSDSPMNLLLNYSRKINAKLGKILIPEFVKNYTHNNGSHKILSDFLINYKYFQEHYSNHGHVYHGTPSIENALAIMRNGFFVSSSEQGRAQFGKGAYFTKEISIARHDFAGSEGLVFELKVNANSNILNWETFQYTEQAKEISNEAKNLGMNVFDYMAQKYNIDIIINHHLVVLNSNAIVIPNGIKTIIDSMILQASNENLNFISRYKAILELKNIILFAIESGVVEKFPNNTKNKLLLDIINSANHKEANKALVYWFTTNRNDLLNDLIQIDPNGETPAAKRILEIILELTKPESAASYSISYSDQFRNALFLIPEFKNFLLTMASKGDPNAFTGLSYIADNNIFWTLFPMMGKGNEAIDTNIKKLFRRCLNTNPKELVSEILKDDPYGKTPASKLLLEQIFDMTKSPSASRYDVSASFYERLEWYKQNKIKKVLLYKAHENDKSVFEPLKIIFLSQYVDLIDKGRITSANDQELKIIVSYLSSINPEEFKKTMGYLNANVNNFIKHYIDSNHHSSQSCPEIIQKLLHSKL